MIEATQNLSYSHDAIKAIVQSALDKGVMPEKMLHEPANAYEAFLHWIALGPTRSARKCAATMPLSISSIQKWMASYTWKARLDDYYENLRKFNDAICLEKWHSLFSVQYDLLEFALQAESAMRARLDFSETSIREYNKLLTLVWRMVADVRTSDATIVRVQAEAQNATRDDWTGTVQKSDIEAIAAQLKEMKDND